ncbi:MAG: carbohydrate-binding domain-containing protein [Lachnospiraceae bacterium]|nr:carbohydrate-binding domain-containing protein [Lachnospiraceae bacterium]
MYRTNKTKSMIKKTIAGLTCITSAGVLCLSSVRAFAEETVSAQTQVYDAPGSFGGELGVNNNGFGGNIRDFFGGDFGSNSGNVTLADEPTDIAVSTVTNTASLLVADEANATTYVMTEDNNDIKIDSAGTYIVTGTCSNGNITVKKGTTGVVLILKDLDLTSTTGATVSLNKNSEVKLVIEGTVKLTDAEDPADEESEDTEIADAFDGAAIKAKDGSNVYLTGSGTLTIDASSCKNGIKVGDADTPSFVVDGSLTININAANDAFNAGYDLTILSGTINISAGDDAIHADRILTIGSSTGSGPSIIVSSCEEGFEGTVVNLFGGNGTVKSSDDGVNAANSDGTYSDELDFSINITGGTWVINAGGDGLDSNGNVNITGGNITITSGSVGGEAGIDYDGSCYISGDATVVNNSGISGPDGAAEMPGDGVSFPGGGNFSGDGLSFPGDESHSEDNVASDSDNSSSENENTNTDSGAVSFGWGTGDSSSYWYENGVRQGTESDDKCFSYAGTLRGREIYDPESDGWYWLDVNADGAKAVGKEVFMPYIYQDEANWSDEEIETNSMTSDSGLEEYVAECIKNGTGKWVRYDENGSMLKGWVTIEGTLAELYPLQAGNTYYYDTKTGLMAKGALTIDGEDHYFDVITGVMIY